MTLSLYYHPLASFCHKVLIALYENETPFDGRIVDLGDPAASAEFLGMWPVGKIPVLRDDSRNQTIPETTIIIEYLDRYYPGSRPMLPVDDQAQIDARLWDRFYDHYVSVPMQKIVLDRLRPTGERDPRGVADAETMLQTAYEMIERQMTEKTWSIGSDFSIADCLAAPALFYAGIVAPFSKTHKNTGAYFERLVQRPSFKRAIFEAQPYFKHFPLADQIPARFRARARGV